MMANIYIKAVGNGGFNDLVPLARTRFQACNNKSNVDRRERSSGFTKASKQDNEQGDQTLLDGDSVLQRAWCHLVASKTSNCLGRRSWVHRESLLNEILLCLERQLPWRYLQVFLAALGIVLRYRSTRNKPRQEATPCLLGWHVGDSELLFALCVLPGLNVYEVGVARTHHAPRGEDPPPASPRRWSKECFSTEAAMAPNVSPAWLQRGGGSGSSSSTTGPSSPPGGGGAGLQPPPPPPPLLGGGVPGADPPPRGVDAERADRAPGVVSPPLWPPGSSPSSGLGSSLVTSC